MGDKVADYLARNIKALRKIYAWSSTELANRSGIHRNYIRAIERAERNIGIEHLQRLAQAFGVAAYELILPPNIRVQVIYEPPEDRQGIIDQKDDVEEYRGCYLC